MSDPAPPDPRSKRDWEQGVLAPARARTPERADTFLTPSGRRTDVAYTPEDVDNVEYRRDIADPGAFPFTRGIRRSVDAPYTWTFGQLAGQGTPAAVNARSRHLLASGATSLTVGFDEPTLTGRDPDYASAAGKVGRGGVSMASVDDMIVLLGEIDPGVVPMAMASNASAPMVFAMFLVAVERCGGSWPAVSGSLQNDILQDLITRRRLIYPLASSMRLVADTMAFCVRHTPRWIPLSIGGHRIHEAGATARQELSLAIGIGIAWVEHAVAAGLDVDTVGERLLFVLNVRADLFPEIARCRAARHVWAHVMRERFGARTDAGCGMRLHTQTAGASPSSHRQPGDDIVRTTYEALAAVLGGTSSLHTSIPDERSGLSAIDASTLALRAQQILANESGLTGTADPFGGSWYLEHLTRDVIDETMADIAELDRAGGMAAALEQGIPQRWIVGSAGGQTRRADSGRSMRGVEAEPASGGRRGQAPAGSEEAERVGQIRAFRERRDTRALEAASDHLRATASGQANVMDALLVCARANVTLGEMCDVLRNVWGECVESPTS